mgnify:CR=1 FL=1
MLSRLILMTALVLAVVAAFVALGERYPGFRFGRLPGDIVIRRDGNTLFIPITSMLVVSLLLSLGFGLLRLFKR